MLKFKFDPNSRPEWLRARRKYLVAVNIEHVARQQGGSCEHRYQPSRIIVAQVPFEVRS